MIGNAWFFNTLCKEGVAMLPESSFNTDQLDQRLVLTAEQVPLDKFRECAQNQYIEDAKDVTSPDYRRRDVYEWEILSDGKQLSDILKEIIKAVKVSYDPCGDDRDIAFRVPGGNCAIKASFWNRRKRKLRKAIDLDVVAIAVLYDSDGPCADRLLAFLDAYGNLYYANLIGITLDCCCRAALDAELMAWCRGIVQWQYSSLEHYLLRCTDPMIKSAIARKKRLQGCPV